MDMPTAIPRFNLVAQVGWSPTADRTTNPFTGYTATQQGRDNIAANELEIELGGTVALIRPQDTKGWFGLKVGAFDQIGAARQADDGRTSATSWIWRSTPVTGFSTGCLGGTI